MAGPASDSTLPAGKLSLILTVVMAELAAGHSPVQI